KHLEHVEVGADEHAIFLKAMTNQSQIFMAQACNTRVFINGKEPSDAVKGIYKEEGYISQNIKLNLKKTQPLLVEKVICIYTSKDRAISECLLEAREAVKRLGTFEELFNRHRIAWKHLWQNFDIGIEYAKTEENISMLLRLHIFHLL